MYTTKQVRLQWKKRQWSPGFDTRTAWAFRQWFPTKSADSNDGSEKFQAMDFAWETWMLESFSPFKDICLAILDKFSKLPLDTFVFQQHLREILESVEVHKSQWVLECPPKYHGSQISQDAGLTVQQFEQVNQRTCTICPCRSHQVPSALKLLASSKYKEHVWYHSQQHKTGL